jgi:outer membrane protein OmpA-like peptidoglycan-associated protein
MRGAGRTILVLGLGALGASAAFAQSKAQFRSFDEPRYDLSVGYVNIRANAPPGNCNCFYLNGGYLSGSIHLTRWLGVTANFTGAYGSNIGLLGQDLTLMTFTAGPRVVFRLGRLTPFGEVLIGGAHGSNSYFPSATSSSPSASSFAVSSGGGLDIWLTPRLAVRAIELEYLRTSLPNGVNNEQNQLTIAAGLVIKFRGRSENDAPARIPPVTAAVAVPPQPASVAFTCGTNVANVPLGQLVVITGNASTEPDRLNLTYSWSTDAGAIEGSGNVVSINTTGMTVGDYRVEGHASLTSAPSTVAECIAVFRVVAVEVPPAPTTTYITLVDSSAKDSKLFAENVRDAHFDLNSAAIRPDTQISINRAAKYLVAHPTIQVLISGWTDPRGSMKFNLALGEKRANAVRDGLIAAGVPEGQLETISNGMSSQTCTQADQQCWQENRRVSFTMKP